MSASQMRRSFHSVGMDRRTSYHESHDNVEAGERHRLLGNGSAEGRYTNHQNKVIAYPAKTVSITWQVLKTNYVNVLLVFVPLGIISGVLNWSPTVVFILNFIAIIPLASLLAFATEELAVPCGQTIGGLLNATFGNAVELIVSIIALQKGEIRVVQSSMLGSILSNILLVLGCCFLAGGIRYKEQKFNETVASTMSSLLVVAVASLIIPATLYSVMSKDEAQQQNVNILSRGTSIVLLLIYIAYLFFQLKTHTELFEEANEGEEEEQEEEHILNAWSAGAFLVFTTILVAICADYLVAGINPIVETAHISKTFIGLILIPIVGNAAEHVTAVIVAYKNKMDLAIGVAIGSSIQIAIFVTPFLVILGWIMQKDMSLHFETFETISFFLSSLVVILLIQDGKSNYLEGLLCLGMYIIIALAFWILPDDVSSGTVGGTVVNGLLGGSGN